MPAISEFSSLKELTDFAVDFRYEPFDKIDAVLDRKAILNNIQEFFSLISKQINEQL
jgi:hypothetical protein